MRPAFALLILFIIYSKSSWAQSTSTSGRLEGMGNVQVAIADLFSQNQGNLALLENHEVGMYSKQPFHLKELSQYYLNGAFVSKWGNFGLKTHYSGYNDFNKTQIGFGYGKKLWDNFSAGIQVNMHQYSITNYGTSTFFTVEMGFSTKLSESFDLGFHLFNPSNTNINTDNGLSIATKPLLNLGLCYHTDDYLISTEVSKEGTNVAPNLKVGAEYTLYKALYLRAGINTNPHLFTAGFGTVWSNIKLDISYTYHQLLGSTPGISISYIFKKNEE